MNVHVDNAEEGMAYDVQIIIVSHRTCIFVFIQIFLCWIIINYFKLYQFIGAIVLSKFILKQVTLF